MGLANEAIIEQEYQKRLAEHGITFRPDIIIHVPTAPGAFSIRASKHHMLTVDDCCESGLLVRGTMWLFSSRLEHHPLSSLN